MKSPRFLLNIAKTLIIGSVAFTVAKPASAQQWWFDVEVVVFKRLQDADALTENFGEWQAIDTSGATDLLTPYLYPDVTQLRQSLPSCSPELTPLPSIESLNQALLESERALEIQQSLLDDNQSDAQVFDTEDGSLQQTELNSGEENSDNYATDDLFRQLGQEQSDEDEYTNDTFEEIPSFLSEEELQQAFTQFMQEADSDIAWVDANPLASTACQFPQEERYLKDLISPFELATKTVESTPRNINPPYKNYIGKPYLLPSYDFQLSTMARDLNRQRGVRIMSHMLWRQEVVFGRSKAPAFRLLAGQNFGNEYMLDGTKRIIDSEYSLAPSPFEDESQTETLRLPEEDALLNQISALIEGTSAPKSIEQVLNESEMAIQLSDNTQPTNGQEEALMNYPPVWELDGLFKVYLQRLGQTPYLHIDSELNFRQPGIMLEQALPSADLGSGTEANNQEFLHSYKFKQLRRIISKQIHYFDHPAFGLIIQLRRYHPPTPEEETNS